MTDKWTDLLKSGMAEGVPIIGVTINLPIHIHPYRLKHDITFPIYSDTADTFMEKYQVYSFPYQVVAGKSGTIVAVSESALERVDIEKLRADLAR